MNEIFEYFCGKKQLAKLLHIQPAAVSGWIKHKKISDHAALKIERMSYGRFKAIDTVELKS